MYAFTDVNVYVWTGPKYNKNRTAENWDAFRRQRNLCVKLFCKAKRDFYNQIDISAVTDNKNFGKRSNLLFRVRAHQNLFT